MNKPSAIPASSVYAESLKARLTPILGVFKRYIIMQGLFCELADE